MEWPNCSSPSEMWWYSERIVFVLYRVMVSIRLYAIGPPYKYKDVETFWSQGYVFLLVVHVVLRHSFQRLIIIADQSATAMHCSLSRHWWVYWCNNRLSCEKYHSIVVCQMCLCRIVLRQGHCFPVGWDQSSLSFLYTWSRGIAKIFWRGFLIQVLSHIKQGSRGAARATGSILIAQNSPDCYIFHVKLVLPWMWYTACG